MTNFRDVLLLQKRELENYNQKTYVPRDVQLKELDKDIIKVIIGPRRAGKSFFAIHQLKKTGNFGYINFDDESLVAVELKRRELMGELEFYYYKNPLGYEIDFVVKRGLEITELIQVCYDVTDEKTRSREIRALLHGFKDLHCPNLTIITGDYENRETIEWYGIKGEIQFIPLWKWLLNRS